MPRSSAVCLSLRSAGNFDSCNSRHVPLLRCSVWILSMRGRNIAFHHLRYYGEIGGRGEAADVEQAS